MRRLLLLLLCYATPLLADSVMLQDDAGHTVQLSQPAQRIITLAPHLTELLFAAGAGEHLVGTAEYSNYPPAAEAAPRIGGYNRLDAEQIIALQPDLIVAWLDGNDDRVVTQLQQLGFTIYFSSTKVLADIPRTLRQLGRLSGTEAEASRNATTFEQRLDQLRQRYQDREPVSVFYQVWHQPLMTIGAPHIISRVIELCGGKNVFADLDTLAAPISTEAVLLRDPQAIVASGMDEARPQWLDAWRDWPQLAAVKHRQLHFVPPDLLQRATPRLLDGAAQLCEALDQARQMP